MTAARNPSPSTGKARGGRSRRVENSPDPAAPAAAKPGGKPDQATEPKGPPPEVAPERDEAPAAHVIEALCRVMRDMPGIGKDRRAAPGQGGYAYRGIEDITPHTQVLFARHGVLMVPRVVRWEIRSITVAGNPWMDVIEEVEYDVYGPGGPTDKIVIGPLLAIGRDNSDKGANKCQPTGTMVRVPHMIPNGRRPFVGWHEESIETLKPGDRVVSWHRFRSGSRTGLVPMGRTITGVAVRPYEGPLITVKAGDRVSRYTPDHLCVVRHGALNDGNFVVYLMKRGDQYRIGHCRWQPRTTGKPRNGLIRRIWQERADAGWILDVTATEGEAALIEALTAVRYGIPDVTFAESTKNPYRFSLDDFWSKLGANQAQADTCLRSFGLSIYQPLLRRPQPGILDWLSYDGVAAANLRSGMKMAIATDAANGVQWMPVEVTRDYYQGLVYSLEVDKDETYVADGIVTHNCLTQAEKYALLQALQIADRETDADGTTTVATSVEGHHHAQGMETQPPHLKLISNDEVNRLVALVKGQPDEVRALIREQWTHVDPMDDEPFLPVDDQGRPHFGLLTEHMVGPLEAMVARLAKAHQTRSTASPAPAPAPAPETPPVPPAAPQGDQEAPTSWNEIIDAVRLLTEEQVADDLRTRELLEDDMSPAKMRAVLVNDIGTKAGLALAEIKTEADAKAATAPAEEGESTNAPEV